MGDVGGPGETPRPKKKQKRYACPSCGRLGWDTTVCSLCKTVQAYSRHPVGPWVADAACRGADNDIWYPDHGSGAWGQRTAKRICFTCPVRLECLKHALDAGEQFGIWGGLNPHERKALQRRAAARRGPGATMQAGSAA